MLILVKLDVEAVVEAAILIKIKVANLRRHSIEYFNSLIMKSHFRKMCRQAQFLSASPDWPSFTNVRKYDCNSLWYRLF